MCYHCMETAWLRVVPAVLQQQNNAHPTAELLENFKALASAMKAGASFDRNHVHGHDNPLTFATAVVAEQMIASISDDDGANLTPRRMLDFSRQALRRMNTVEDHDPYGRAVAGVREMPRVLRQLNDALLPDTAQGRDAVAADDTASSATSEVG
uniref:Uncharacterized protein n=1 Tax=Ditylum brightwellii TaxID=49249 RepID=A0A7S4RAW6_9STRA|mmetsp:Transcript_20335/g.29798  ORF Transcript_20335/g.29798 Transcript_20335/m.29798 type:complete len:154 (-) Transcript_20335:151-612(-)